MFEYGTGISFLKLALRFFHPTLRDLLGIGFIIHEDGPFPKALLSPPPGGRSAALDSVAATA